MRDMTQVPKGNSSQDFALEYGPAQVPYEISVPPEEQQKMAEKSEAQEKPEKKLSSREAVLAKYGDPEKNRELSLDPTASPEMKGIAAALNIGDKELAFQYARAHVRYQKEVGSFVDRASEYQIAAMEVEGIKRPRDNNAESSDPYRQELRSYYDKTKKELQPKVTKDIEAMISNEEELHNQELARAMLQTAKMEADQKIPVDPEGLAKVYYFFSFDDQASLKSLNGILELRKLYQQDTGVEFRGFTVGGRKPSELEALRKQHQIDFPVIAGEALRKELRITSVPAAVFVATSTGETYVMQGERSGKEFEEVLRKMRGEI